MAVSFVIGIDGGGTRSRAIAVSVEGDLLGEVSGGPLNYNTTSPGKFSESLGAILQQFSEVHDLDSAAEQTVIGTASLFTSLDPDEATKVCGGLLPADRLTVVGDVVTALYGATLGAPGLIVVSGTGSIAAAMEGQGNAIPPVAWARRAAATREAPAGLPTRFCSMPAPSRAMAPGPPG